MSLKELLEYQRIDTPIYHAEQEVNRSEEKKSYMLLYDKINNGFKRMSALDDEVGHFYAEIEKYAAQIKEIASNKNGNNILNDLKSLENGVNYYEKTERTLANIEKELDNIYMKLDKAKGEAYKLTVKIKELQKEFAVAKKIYDDKNEAIKNNFAESFAELNKLEKKIDPRLLGSYKNLRKNQQIPELVMYSDGFCRGCGMNIYSEINEKMKDEGTVLECPNCRRLIYKG